MKTNADVVVVGGGVMGCSILYNLAANGVPKTTLLERDVLACGSTGHSQAILRTHYSNEVTTRMAWESLHVFREFEDIIGSSSGYTKTGYFLIVENTARIGLEKNVAMQRQVGVDTAVASMEDVREIAPMLLTQNSEAFAYEPQSGYADPYLVTTGYARRARELGATINIGTPAISIEVSGGRVTAVVTSTGKIETDAVVVASGPWSKTLLNNAGIDVPLRTLRHQIVAVRRPKGLIPNHPIIGDVVNSISARPDIGELTLIGIGDDQYVGLHEYDHGVDTNMVATAMVGLSNRIASMDQSEFLGGWSGLFTVTPDWHPILDQINGVDGLYCAIGFSGHGFKLSPMVGSVVADMITDGPFKSISRKLVAELGLSRFKQEKLMHSNYKMKVLA